MASQQLQLGDNAASPGFLQQGQVDWVAFASTTVKTSISIMQRCSAAGVQPVTVAGGLALGSRFELGKKGVREMDLALKALNGRYGFDKLLYYGFGYRSFVNILTETRVGINLVALCACLVDMHSIPIAAEVLASLWKLEAFPEDYEPSLSQFNALATACAGVVAATRFGQIGDMMLGDLRKHMKKSGPSRLPRASISPPEDIAKALHGLFQISQGRLERIEISGGHGCAFLAALAHWLLNLTLHVEDDTGTPIYLDVLDREAAQVRIRYQDPHLRSSELSVTSTTFVLRDNDMIFAIDERNSALSLNVRTAWDGCLKRAFWGSAQRLMAAHGLLGDFLGSAARVFAALARGEPDVGDFQTFGFGDFVDRSYGHGFIETVGTVFPELGRIEELSSTMSRALNNPIQQTLTNLQVTISSLVSLCDCCFCSGEPSSAPFDDRLEDRDAYCVLVIAMTITALVRHVACLEIHGTINPTVAGLQLIYEQYDRRVHTRTGSRHSVPALDAVLGFDLTSGGARLALSTGRLIADVQCLFTGQSLYSNGHDIRDYATALSSNGICCYFEALNGISSNAAVLRRVHILPGRIQKGNREYSTVTDLEYRTEAPLLEATLGTKTTTIPTKFREEDIDIKAVVAETASGSLLRFSYEASVQGTLTRIHPSVLTQRVLRRTGFIACDKRMCEEDLEIPCNVIQEGWSGLPYTLSREEQPCKCLIWPFRENDVGRCIAICTAPFDDVLYVRNGECLSCCTKAVAEEPFSVII